MLSWIKAGAAGALHPLVPSLRPSLRPALPRGLLLRRSGSRAFALSLHSALTQALASPLANAAQTSTSDEEQSSTCFQEMLRSVYSAMKGQRFSPSALPGPEALASAFYQFVSRYSVTASKDERV